jgi:Glyoxalase/Bleomycin resistance protein/Dioxygenase superfamily
VSTLWKTYLEHALETDIRSIRTSFHELSIGDAENVLELTYNYDGRTYELGTGYGHIAVGVDDLDGTLANLKEQGIEPERPPIPCARGWLEDLLRSRSR